MYRPLKGGGDTIQNGGDTKSDTRPIQDTKNPLKILDEMKSSLIQKPIQKPIHDNTQKGVCIGA